MIPPDYLESLTPENTCDIFCTFILEKIAPQFPHVSFVAFNQTKKEADEMNDISDFISTGQTESVEILDKNQLNAGNIAFVGIIAYRESDIISEALTIRKTIHELALKMNGERLSTDQSELENLFHGSKNEYFQVLQILDELGMEITSEDWNKPDSDFIHEQFTLRLRYIFK